MTQQRQSGAIGPGRLILVVGPSGAGKDTLIGLVQAACEGDEAVMFVRRIVTRESSPFENNVQVAPAAFAAARGQGAFAVSWEAHGLHYALPRSMDDDIAAGRTVVANVSRAVISELRGAYANVVVVSVTAPAAVLVARLEARGRASDGPLGARLNRQAAAGMAEADVTISNVGEAETHAYTLQDVVRDNQRAKRTGDS